MAVGFVRGARVLFPGSESPTHVGGEPFTVDKNVITGRRVREIWYDPRYGCSYLFHTRDTHGHQT